MRAQPAPAISAPSFCSRLADMRARIARDPLCGAEAHLSMWVAPGVCIVAEIAQKRSGGTESAWAETLSFERYDELLPALRRIVRKRLLAGRSIVLLLCTSQLFAWRGAYEEDTSLDEQGVLPGAPPPEQLECSRSIQDAPVNACMRRGDVRLWIRIIEGSGLVPGVFAPSGPCMGELLQTATEIRVRLAQGTVEYRFDDAGWNATTFVPRQDEAIGAEEVTLSCESRPTYAHLSAGALLCLEGVLSARRRPECSCNPHTYRALEADRIQNRYWRVLRRVGVATVVGLAVLVMGLCALAGARAALDRVHARDREQIAAARRVREENESLRNRLAGHREYLALRGNTAKLLAAVGGAVCDSLWFSELRFTDAGGRQVEIIGHAYADRMVSTFMASLQAHELIAAVTLDYAEKLGRTDVARLTGWRRKRELVRYKLTLEPA
ncbi:MAG: hypothetical protein GF331_12405 [Chitinivibrionales bacterium]|nr:hypothetical protein [Chitinivibrionales bacterium]